MRTYFFLVLLYAFFSFFYAAVEGLSLSILPIILRVLLGNVSQATLVPALKSVRPVQDWLQAHVVLDDKYIALKNLSIFVASVFIGKFFVGSVKKFSILSLMEIVARDLRDRAFASILKADLSSLKGVRSGDLVSRLTGEINYIKLAIRDGFGNLIGEGFNLLVFAFLALTSAPVLSVFAWGILIVASLLGWMVARIVKRRSAKAMSSLGDLSAYLSKSFEGIKVIKSLNVVSEALENFYSHSRRLYLKFLKLELSAALAPILSETLVGLSAALILFMAGYFIFKAKLVQVDAFVVFLAASLSMIRPLKLIFQSIAYINTARSSYDRLKELLKLPEERWGNLNPEDWKVLELKGVKLSYGKQLVLDVPYMKIRRGEKVAIVGRSGSGKSTLLDVIAGFIRPDEGEILLDGRRLYDYSLDGWRRIVGYVPQEVYIFDGTLRENLGNADEETVKALLLGHLKARLDEPVINLKDSLSGGERQRIGIIRVLQRRPKILLMDEPTSALDLRSETAVWEMLKGEKDLTLIVVAHKRSTALWGEKVIVMEGGKVVCSGTHEELRKACSLYTELMENVLSSQNVEDGD